MPMNDTLLQSLTVCSFSLVTDHEAFVEWQDIIKLFIITSCSCRGGGQAGEPTVNRKGQIDYFSRGESDV